MSEILAGEFHDALTAANLEYAGMSWGGFNLFGDRKSIDEAKRLLHKAGKVAALQDRLKAADEEIRDLRHQGGEDWALMAADIP